MVAKRRSMTIREENDENIKYMRSQLLYSNIDIDYTTIVNIFIELGDMILRPGTYNMTNITDIFKKYLGDIDNDIILHVLNDYNLNDYKDTNMRKHE
jgi:hypothetical protein